MIEDESDVMEEMKRLLRTSRQSSSLKHGSFAKTKSSNGTGKVSWGSNPETKERAHGLASTISK